ncbi:MAG: nucleotide-binding universal stress UspA family protein [Cyclobacteriaceae bacterium]|jgi:nucleotide-binding universal stress UspA family protein
MKAQNILVPLDFSNCSKNALKIAIGLAQSNHATLYLLNAIHIATPYVDVTGGHSLVEPVIEDYEKRVEKEFEVLKKEFVLLKDVDFFIKKYVCMVSDAIDICLKEENIDVIIMGTKGSHSTLEKLIGGVSADVISQTNVPVLLIPENISSLAFNRIGYAADFDNIDDLGKLEPLIYFAQLTKAEIQIFNITKNVGDISFDKSRQSLKISNYLKDVNHSFHTIEDDKIVHGIFEFIEDHSLDMLAIYPRKHGFFERILMGSVTKKIAMNIHIPLLSIHE